MQEITTQTVKHWYALPREEKCQYLLQLWNGPDGNISISRMETWHLLLKAYNPFNKKYVYLCTFTKKNAEDDDDEIEKYIKKQFKRKPLKVVEAYIVKEKTKADVSHWHVAVETEKPLKKDRFNYYIKKYGFIDISKNKEQNIDTTINYISKDILPTKI